MSRLQVLDARGRTTHELGRPVCLHWILEGRPAISTPLPKHHESNPEEHGTKHKGSVSNDVNLGTILLCFKPRLPGGIGISIRPIPLYMEVPPVLISEIFVPESPDLSACMHDLQGVGAQIDLSFATGRIPPRPKKEKYHERAEPQRS